MKFPRASGILLHPTSLPGAFGIGDLGDAALRWIDFLSDTNQTLWQLMPLGYTGYGDSPYQSFSAFAGDPLLISPERLHHDGFLTAADLKHAPAFPAEKVDYGPVITWKMGLLHQAYRRFKEAATADQRAAFQTFAQANAHWLDDFALFMALKQAHGGAAWNTWEPELKRREPAALAEWTAKLAEGIEEHKFYQWQFFTQWERVKAYANERNIKVIGDVPIFVAYDSDDVWANAGLFDLDADGNPRHVAGVPPDYFSATGQLWGNPLYNWEAMADAGYAWWIERFRAALKAYDIIRIDHFRGFEAYWSIPFGDKTAVNGQWVKGPGRDLFLAVKAQLGDLPIIAEDLGLLTADVIALRDAMEFPGMKILQFAFGTDPRQEYLPHNYAPNCVVYSGTHDNDTWVGWFATASEAEKGYLLRYVGGDGSDIHWAVIRLAWGSIADMAIVPLQDVLGLGSEARMNTPGVAAGNWGWRYHADALTPEVASQLKALTYDYGRGLTAPEPPKRRQRHPHSTHPRLPHPHSA